MGWVNFLRVASLGTGKNSREFSGNRKNSGLLVPERRGCLFALALAHTLSPTSLREPFSGVVVLLVQEVGNRKWGIPMKGLQLMFLLLMRVRGPCRGHVEEMRAIGH